LHSRIYVGYSVEFILVVVSDLFLLRCRIWFYYSLGLMLVIP